MRAASTCIRKHLFSCLPSSTVWSAVAVLECPISSTPSAAMHQCQTKQQHRNLLNVRLHRTREGGKKRKKTHGNSFLWNTCITECTFCACHNSVLGELNKINIELWRGKKRRQRVCAFFLFWAQDFFATWQNLLSYTLLALSESSWSSKHKSINEATCCLAFYLWILQTIASFQFSEKKKAVPQRSISLRAKAPAQLRVPSAS